VIVLNLTQDILIGPPTVEVADPPLFPSPPYYTALSYRQAFKERRCLIPADGFFEWKEVVGGKIPYSIGMKDSFALRVRSSPSAPSSSRASSKPAMAPGTSFEAYPIPVLAEPKKIIRALDQLRSLKTFPSPDAVNTTTRPQLPKYISHALGSLYQPWKPG